MMVIARSKRWRQMVQMSLADDSKFVEASQLLISLDGSRRPLRMGDAIGKGIVVIPCSFCCISLLCVKAWGWPGNPGPEDFVLVLQVSE